MYANMPHSERWDREERKMSAFLSGYRYVEKYRISKIVEDNIKNPDLSELVTGMVALAIGGYKEKMYRREDANRLLYGLFKELGTNYESLELTFNLVFNDIEKGG